MQSHALELLSWHKNDKKLTKEIKTKYDPLSIVKHT